MTDIKKLEQQKEELLEQQIQKLESDLELIIRTQAHYLYNEEKFFNYETQICELTEKIAELRRSEKEDA